MQQRQTRDFLIRKMPIEVYHLLEKSANEHHRSKTQEAILALTNGLSINKHQIQQPEPFKWKKRLTSRFIRDAIEEGRE